MISTRPSSLSTWVAVAAFVAVGCGGSSSPGDTPSLTNIASHTVTIENARYDSYAGKGFVNLYDGVVYGGANATANADKIDFRHQYRGVEIGNTRLFENMTTKGRWDRGLFTGITPTDSRIVATGLNERDFDMIYQDHQLLDAFDFTGTMHASEYLMDIDDNPIADVYAFIDKNGRRGLFRVLSADTGPINTAPQGNLTIEVKVEL
jgi:hypothetical protein